MPVGPFEPTTRAKPLGSVPIEEAPRYLCRHLPRSPICLHAVDNVPCGAAASFLVLLVETDEDGNVEDEAGLGYTFYCDRHEAETTTDDDGGA